jgi:1-acyl-sn-glycerol-3-phosphate acyltransferase
MRIALNVLQGLFLVAWSVFWISLAVLATVCTLSGELALKMARRCWAPALIWGSGARFRVEPLPALDWTKPRIFVVNHESMLDIPCAFAAIPSNLRFVAKHSLKYVPFLGWYMWLTGMVFVNRGKREQAFASLRKGGERIRNGATILAFPEGTRTGRGQVLPFKKGIFVLALEAGVPIVPVAISGSGKVLPTGGFRLRGGEVRLKMGAPIPTAGRPPEDRDALMREVREAVIRLHREIGGAGGEPDREPAQARQAHASVA